MEFKNIEFLSKKEDFQQALPIIERIFPDLEKLLCLTEKDFSDMLVIKKRNIFYRISTSIFIWEIISDWM